MSRDIVPDFWSAARCSERLVVASGVENEFASGGTCLIAGQMRVDAEGRVVGDGDLAAQLIHTFSNIGDILSALGLGFVNVAQMTTCVSQRAYIREFCEARTKALSVAFRRSMAR